MKRFEQIIAALWGALVVVATILLFTSAAEGQGRALSLKNVVQVSGDHVTLGDAVTSLGNAGSMKDLVLCPTPAPGTVRMLDAAEITSLLKKQGLDITLRGPKQISITRLGRSVSADDLRPLVEAALQSSGSQAVIRRIQVQSAIFIPSGTRLELIKLKFDPAIGSHRVFFVVMKGEQRVAGFEALAMFVSGTTPADVDFSYAGLGSRTHLPLLVHRGESALMQIQGDGFSAMLQVVCLEDGDKERIVRARDTASKKIYRAQVVDSGRLLELSREN